MIWIRCPRIIVHRKREQAWCGLGSPHVRSEILWKYSAVKASRGNVLTQQMGPCFTPPVRTSFISTTIYSISSLLRPLSGWRYSPGRESLCMFNKNCISLRFYLSLEKMDVPAGRSQKIFPFTGFQSRTMERISQSNRPAEVRLESAVIGQTQVDFYGFWLYLPLSGWYLHPSLLGRVSSNREVFYVVRQTM